MQKTLGKFYVSFHLEGCNTVAKEWVSFLNERKYCQNNITLTAAYISNAGPPASPFWPFSPGAPWNSNMHGLLPSRYKCGHACRIYHASHARPHEVEMMGHARRGNDSGTAGGEWSARPSVTAKGDRTTSGQWDHGQLEAKPLYCRAVGTDSRHDDMLAHDAG